MRTNIKCSSWMSSLWMVLQRLDLKLQNSNIFVNIYYLLAFDKDTFSILSILKIFLLNQGG